MKKRFLIIGLSLVIILIIIAFLFYSLAAPRYDKPIININKTQIEMDREAVVLEPVHLSYLLAELNFHKLHNPPLNPETPRININIDDKWYNSEIIQGQIYTEAGNLENPDLTITTSSQEVLNAILSAQTREYVASSVSEGKTALELNAGYSKLFSKGYLSIYKELTGKSLTGSVVKIFSQG